MVWKKLNDYVEMWKDPVLGTEDQKDGKRYMALCVDPSSKNPYRGIARQVTERVGNVDIPGYTDRSRLLIVKSQDLLKWDIVGDLRIDGIDEVLEKLGGADKEFIGLEDPDILIDENGTKHVYFTIPFKHKTNSVNDVVKYDVYVGHAEGRSLDHLVSTDPVLGKVNGEIVGFKEICPIPSTNANYRTLLAETFVSRTQEKGFSAIGLARTKTLEGKWTYQKLVHNPETENKEWCAGHSSPCRIFDPSFLKQGRYLVGIMNGREPTKVIDSQKIYGKFRPGLFLFDSNSGNIVWVDDNHLLEDPIATTITFASDLVYLNDSEAILYAHPNDSFVRAYKINKSRLKKYLLKSRGKNKKLA
jgi:hypothetical protein